jgi:hypothetical protein
MRASVTCGLKARGSASSPAARATRSWARWTAESARADNGHRERGNADVGQLVGKIVRRAPVDVAGEAQGDVHVLGLDPPRAVERRAHQRETRAQAGRYFQRRE